MKKLVILTSGKMQSGKNQLSEFLKKEFLNLGYTVSEDMFAAGVKQGCKEDFAQLATTLNSIADQFQELDGLLPFDLGVELNFGKLIDQLRISEDNWYENKTPITRALLQSYGTEIFRNRVDGDWWVKQLKIRIKESQSDVILVTDVRFPNEIEGLYDVEYDYDLLTIRVNRDLEKVGIEHEHPSETSLDNYHDFSYYIDNNGSLEDLRLSAEAIVSDFRTV